MHRHERRSARTGQLPVLGHFRDEAGLRDHIAANLNLAEQGLELLRIEYPIDSPEGVGGRIDTLARDRFDHVVCIEINRSDRSARETLNELSKYVTLLYEWDRVPREMIRRVVVSTHWFELLLPLSYFAVSSGVDTRWASSPFDPTGEMVALIGALHPTVTTPVRVIEYFVNEGLRLVHEEMVTRGKTPADLLSG